MKPVLAIDVDNTLIHEVDGAVVLNHDVILLMQAVKRLGIASVIVWSGGGAGYAQHVVNKFGLTDLVDRATAKQPLPLGHPSITLDDQDCILGAVNLRLPGAGEPTPLMGM